MIDLLSAAAWLIGMPLAGFLVGRRMARRVRDPKREPAICGCGHHLAFHLVDGFEKGFGGCNHSEGYRDSVRCGCTHYIGPIPVDEFTL